MKKALIVDDEEEICNIVSFVIEDLGYEIEKCHNGADALALCENEKFHLIISDIKMPKLDGFEFYKGLVEKNIKFEKFIFMSGFSTYEEEIEKMDVGFVTKPIDLDELESLVE